MKAQHPLRALLPLWIFLFLFKTGAGLHYTLLSLFGERVFGTEVAGLLIGASSFLQLLLDVPAGRLMDRTGYVRGLRWSSLVFIAAGIVLFFGLTPWTFLTSIALGTFGWLNYGPGANAYILANAPKAQSGAYMSLRDTFESIGIVIAVLLAGAVVTTTPLLVGAITSVCIALAILALQYLPPDKASVLSFRTHPFQHHHIRRMPLRDVLRSVRRLNPASTLLLLHNLSGSTFYGMVWFTVPLVIAHGASSGWLEVGLSMFDLSVVVLGVAIGWLADRTSKITLVLIGLLLFALAGTALGFILDIWFLALAFLTTTGDELSSVALWSWLDVLDSDHREDAELSGLLNVFEDLGWTIGPIAAGFLFDRIGPSWTVAIGAIPILLTWLVAFGSFLHPTIRALRTSAPMLRGPHRPRHRTTT